MCESKQGIGSEQEMDLSGKTGQYRKTTVTHEEEQDEKAGEKWKEQKRERFEFAGEERIAGTRSGWRWDTDSRTDLRLRNCNVGFQEKL